MQNSLSHQEGEIIHHLSLRYYYNAPFDQLWNTIGVHFSELNKLHHE